MIFIFWLILILAVVLVFLFKKFFKVIKTGSLALITGGVKVGKSTLAVYLAWRAYLKIRFKWWLYNKVLIYVFKPFVFAVTCGKVRLSHTEEPLLYSNIPLAINGYTPLSLAILRREERPRYKSVIYVCEASLMADSMFYKDLDANERLLLFNKLIGHETRGGKLIYDTQSISDNHFSVKRSVSSVLYAHHAKKIPFFYVMWVREMIYSDDNSTVNNFSSDIEDTLKMVVVPKFIWRKFDCYCYSALTDDLPCNPQKVHIPMSKRFKKEKRLRVNYVLSFKKFLTVNRDSKEVKKEDEKV